MDVDTELTDYERPRMCATRSRAWLRLVRRVAFFDAEGELVFEPVPEGTRMGWSWREFPRGPLRLVPGLVARVGAREEQRILRGLKQMLESS